MFVGGGGIVHAPDPRDPHRYRSRGALPGSVAAPAPNRAWRSSSGRPSGLTDLYRSVGAAAAREARRWTSDVVTVVSPERHLAGGQAALRGASIVVYLGHGNGLAVALSRCLYPPHPERARAQPGCRRWRHSPPVLRRIVHRAARSASRPVRSSCSTTCAMRAATRSRACPRDRLTSARQRVDNYAAGWLRAGAGAVIADTFGEPRPTSRRSSAAREPSTGSWRGAPEFHDHVLPFAAPGLRAHRPPSTRPGVVGVQPLARLARRA